METILFFSSLIFFSFHAYVSNISIRKNLAGCFAHKFKFKLKLNLQIRCICCLMLFFQFSQLSLRSYPIRTLQLSLLFLKTREKKLFVSDADVRQSGEWVIIFYSNAFFRRVSHLAGSMLMTIRNKCRTKHKTRGKGRIKINWMTK